MNYKNTTSHSVNVKVHKHFFTFKPGEVKNLPVELPLSHELSRYDIKEVKPPVLKVADKVVEVADLVADTPSKPKPKVKPVVEDKGSKK